MKQGDTGNRLIIHGFRTASVKAIAHPYTVHQRTGNETYMASAFPISSMGMHPLIAKQAASGETETHLQFLIVKTQRR